MITINEYFQLVKYSCKYGDKGTSKYEKNNRHFYDYTKSFLVNKYLDMSKYQNKKTLKENIILQSNQTLQAESKAKQDMEEISGIFIDKNQLQSYINKLIPGSFGLQCEFRLQSPYYSRDDDNFYLINNPVLKDRVFKLPMIRGSAWKGMLLKAALKRLREYVETKEIKDIFNCFFSMNRIFGTGSEDFRVINEELKKYIENNDYDIIKKLFNYALFELGINLKITNNGTNIAEQILNQINQKIKNSVKVNLDDEKKYDFEELLDVNRGRAVFYPTYFSSLALEVINPHNRKTKAGTGPIYFEVVPKGTLGVFQVIYLPFNGITEPLKVIKKQAKFDCALLKELTKDVITKTGVGAKTKLGWGKAIIVKYIECFQDWRKYNGQSFK